MLQVIEPSGFVDGPRTACGGSAWGVPPCGRGWRPCARWAWNTLAKRARGPPRAGRAAITRPSWAYVSSSWSPAKPLPPAGGRGGPPRRGSGEGRLPGCTTAQAAAGIVCLYGMDTIQLARDRGRPSWRLAVQRPGFSQVMLQGHRLVGPSRGWRPRVGRLVRASGPAAWHGSRYARLRGLSASPRAARTTVGHRQDHAWRCARRWWQRRVLGACPSTDHATTDLAAIARPTCARWHAGHLLRPQDC
jgi:hypothetical protein